MKKLFYLLVLILILGLVLTGCFLSNVGQVPTNEQSGITYLTKNGPSFILLDSVNIGNTDSETGHSLLGWTDVWTCGPYSVANKTGSWCACHDGGTGLGNMRLIWGDGGETCDPENNWASVTLDAGAVCAKTLKVEHLDGAADDGFNVYVNNVLVGTYVDFYSTNTWTTTVFDISSGNYTGLLTIKFVATASAWGGCVTYGQVAFNMIELYGPCPVLVTIDIKPGSDPNSINLTEQGVLPVAILGSFTFDVSTIAPSTITLGGTGVKFRGSAKAPKLAVSFEDVDGDGIMDLVAFFSVQDLVTLEETTTGLMLEAVTTGGLPVYGIDTVNVVP